MSQAQQDDGTIEVSCLLGDLRVTISGPTAQATSLLQRITKDFQPGHSSPPGSEHSFDLVSQAPLPEPAPSSSTALPTRDQIQAGFEPCPGGYLSAARRLSGSSWTGEDRIKRAWTAGQWAKAVRTGVIQTPNRSQQLDLRPRFYAIVKADNLEEPVICKSATSYWRIVEDLARSRSISHAFPSEVEAKVYLAGAGVTDFEVRD